jgi:hypothetical protein
MGEALILCRCVSLRFAGMLARTYVIRECLVSGVKRSFNAQTRRATIGPLRPVRKFGDSTEIHDLKILPPATPTVREVSSSNPHRFARSDN